MVAKPVTDATAAFYRHYLGEPNRGNLFYQTTIGAGHSLVVAAGRAGEGLDSCNANQSPYIDQCGYDQAGIILQHIYGAAHAAQSRPALAGTLQPFDQSAYTGDDIPAR